MSDISKPAINKRAFTSLFLFFSFILLPISGIPLHYSRTSGSMSVIEHFLMSVHNMSALLFAIAVIIHLSFNWRAMYKYIAEKTNEYFRFKKEMIIAILIISLIVGIFSSHAFHTH